MNLHQKVKQLGKFCCKDGICIDSENRCDGNNHCKDYSDEKYCEIVKIPATYNREITPSSLQKIKASTQFLPAQVRTYVEIQNILTLDEEASQIVLKFNISFKWVDYQLNYKFLKENENENAIKEDNLVWAPLIGFAVPSEVPIDVNQQLSVERRGPAQVDDGNDSLLPNETYTGNDNPLILKMMYHGGFFCDFAKLDLYPFDTQECSVELYIIGPSKASLIPMAITENGPSSIGQYDVKEWRLTGGGKSLKFTVYLGRNIATIFMVTYLPTILMNLVNQATNYSRHNYDLVITVNITCMMVLASVYISVSNSLPVTAAIKNIEIWLLFNLAYPVMVIVVNIILQVNIDVLEISLIIYQYPLFVD